jgi:hypothetical protein
MTRLPAGGLAQSGSSAIFGGGAHQSNRSIVNTVESFK